MLHEYEKPTVRSLLADVVNRLAQFGLTVEDLQKAVETGYREALNTTRNDVRGMFGYLLWGKTFRGLCDQLVVKDWTFDQEATYPAVVRPDGQLAIAVWNGDKGTGLLDGEPAPRRPKGEETKAIVERNMRTLFDDWYFDPRNIDPEKLPKSIQTWVFLVYVDIEAEEVRAELSLPRGISSNGAVATWHERILLGPQPIVAHLFDGVIEPETTAEFEVKRRDQRLG